jgi:hypothetical protein
VLCLAGGEGGGDLQHIHPAIVSPRPPTHAHSQSQPLHLLRLCTCDLAHTRHLLARQSSRLTHTHTTVTSTLLSHPHDHFTLPQMADQLVSEWPKPGQSLVEGGWCTRKLAPASLLKGLWRHQEAIRPSLERRSALRTRTHNAGQRGRLSDTAKAHIRCLPALLQSSISLLRCYHEM